MRQTVLRTNPTFPGITVIDLTNKFGAFTASLIRHWNDERATAPWYEWVLRSGDVTYSFAIERKQAAQILAAEAA